ncbi:MAG: tRNA (adenosine(37)-N6)-threonylcarbamoyltransferase complex ATPase subunit type 1 TsaE [Candidatus Paceibacterota bacterium]|jgi:tRNA threonylcarbamoyladenosine biosynthesis protein TsaE
MKNTVSNSLEETQNIARKWLLSISDNSNNTEAVIIGLLGHLGSGKTTFTQAIAKELGIEDHVTSPTFVIMKTYETKNKRFPRLVHIDAYRLEFGRELEVLDFEEVVSNPNNLVLIEWADNVKEILPVNVRFIEFEAIGENERSIKFISNSIFE